MPDAADMTVLQASAYEIGGAGAVMLDLHREYMRRDIDSWVAVGRARHADARVLEVPNDAARSGWTRAVTRLAGAGAGEDERALSPLAKALLVAADPGRYQAILAGVEDFAFPATAALLDLPPRRPNVLHLHNLHGYYFDLRKRRSGQNRRIPDRGLRPLAKRAVKPSWTQSQRGAGSDGRQADQSRQR